MKGEEYICENCLGSFFKTCSDAEMLDEMEEVMPEAIGCEVAIVCHDCWIELMEAYEKLTLEEKLAIKDEYIRGNYN